MRHRFLHIMRPALLMALSLALTGAVADVNSPLSLACPQAISVGNDLDQCSALVTYPDPGVTGGNGAVTVSCVPPSGSTFPVGTTTVNCTATDPSGQRATCQFTVTVRDIQAPTCSLFFQIIDPPLGLEFSNSLTVVATSRAGVPHPFFLPDEPFPLGTRVIRLGFRISDNCDFGFTPPVFTRTDGLPLNALYPVGDTVLALVVIDGHGNSTQCSVTITVLPQSLALVSKKYLEFRIPAPGEAQIIQIVGQAEIKLRVDYPFIPQEPMRVHAQINLHDVVATWNGVEYHATNNVNAQFTSNQIALVPLNVPGRYKFEAHGKAAVKSFSLDLPLQGAIDRGVLSASFGPPQLVR